MFTKKELSDLVIHQKDLIPGFLLTNDLLRISVFPHVYTNNQLNYYLPADTSNYLPHV